MSRVNIRLGRFVNWRRTLMLVILCLVIDGHSTKVQTKFGPIRGFWSKSAKGRLTANYLGVPYAEPPIGDLRFRSSKPWTRKWNTTYDATVNGNMCLQPLPDGQIIGTEDCLNLNIFVPIFADKAERRLKLPVLVYVHGGKYIFGNNHRHMSPPVQLMDQNLVLVTINYRLNIMGFFSTETSTAPGNYGLKDIVMALRWVQENIEVFHGDPKSVTLWGHSAGAGAVHTLSFSKNTEGLFHKYIIQSGSIFAPWNMNPENWMRQISLEAAKLLDCLPEGIETSTARLPSYRECNTEDRYCSSKDSDLIKLEEEMMSCMRSLDGKTIADALKHFNIAKIHSCCLFGPVVEEESEDAVLTAHPMEIIKKREFRDLPCIVGLVRDEGLVTTLDIKGDLDKLKHNFEKDIIILVEMHNRAIDSDEVSSSVEEFYFDSNVPELRFENLTQVVGDSALVWPVYQMLRHQSPVMNSSIFFYFFTYEGTFSYTLNLDPLVHYGVTHGDDLDYLMPYLNEKNKGLQWNDADVTMSDIMTAMWGNFVATGVPSASNNISWPDYKHGHEYLIMGNGREPKLSVGNKFLPARMAFWIEVTNDTDEIDGQEESAQPKQTLPFKGVSGSSLSQE